MTPWLSSALLRLESVSLWGDCLDADQLTELFLSLSQTTTRDLRLRRLNISVSLNKFLLNEPTSE